MVEIQKWLLLLRIIWIAMLKSSSCNWSEAENIVKKKLIKKPNETFLLWILGNVYVQNHKYAEAEPILENLVGKLKKKKKLRLLLSKVYFNQQKYENVLKLLLNYEGLRDKDEHNYYLGVSLMKLGNYDEAITYLKKHAQRHSENYGPFVQLGYAYYMGRQYKLALDAYRRAEVLNPTQKEIKESILLCMEQIPGMRSEFKCF